MEYDPVLDKQFEEEIKNKPDNFYCVSVQVYYNESAINKEPITTDDMKSHFRENKDKLEKYVKDNEIYVYTSLEFMPRMSLKMTGKQILELSKKEYIQYIARGDKKIATIA